MRIEISKLPPAVIALVLQAGAFAITFTAVRLTHTQPSVMTFALLCGGLAACLSYVTKLASWWLIIQFLFLPAAVLLLQVAIPPIWFLGLFLLLLVVYWSTFRTQVPLYLSSDKVWLALAGLLPKQHKGQTFAFIDLGCGLGGVLTYLSRIRPDGCYHGVELAPLPFVWSWLRIRLGGRKNCRVERRSLWDCHLHDYDVVFAYLSPVPMAQLWHKAQAEMRPGSVFISSTFEVPEQTPAETLKINDWQGTTLLIWRM